MVGPAGPARGGWPGLGTGPVRCVLGARKAWTGLETGPSGKGGEGKGELGGGSVRWDVTAGDGWPTLPGR